MASLKVEMTKDGDKKSTNGEFAERDLAQLLGAIRTRAGLGDNAFVFERDKDVELSGDFSSRNALAVVISRCKKVKVEVRFDTTKSHDFSPSATIFRVLRWAIGKDGFNLDEAQQGKANLIIPGTDTPLPRDSVLASYLDGKECTLLLELTLKDFTNG